MGIPGVAQKKGDPEKLDGRLTVYATVTADPGEMASMNHPIAGMVHNGFLVAQGNYREQNNLQDFLKSEMGLSFEEGLSEFLEKLDGLESALDPDKLREKMGNLDDIQDFIPTPAKIVPFNSEEEILAQEGDVFCVGRFENIANANLSVNSFPILYQARFREQQMDRLRGEINQMIEQVERAQVPPAHYTTPGVDVEEKLLREFIPNLLYCRKDERVFASATKQLKAFLKGYSFPEDVDRMIEIIGTTGELSGAHYKLLELYAKKIAEMHRENFGEVNALEKEIDEKENEVGDGRG